MSPCMSACPASIEIPNCRVSYSRVCGAEFVDARHAGNDIRLPGVPLCHMVLCPSIRHLSTAEALHFGVLAGAQLRKSVDFNLAPMNSRTNADCEMNKSATEHFGIV